MVANINNFGVINFYENSNSKSDSSKKSDPICQDATPAEDLSSNSSESDSGSPYFPYLTKKCFEQKRVETVEAEIRAACKGTAEDMWRTLWNNENLGYLEVEYINASTLYRDIEKCFGKLPYKERNFRDARTKR